MKNSKGISMISLIITIICILIFVGLSYRIGSRYIKVSKEDEKDALVSVISNAVTRRQNDKYISVGNENIYYSGYPMSEEEFNRILGDDHDWGNGLWFIVDAKSAEDLGVVDPEQFLVEDLTNPTEEDDDKYVAIVDYDTGKVELVYYDGDVDKEEIKDIAQNYKDNETGCTHTFSVVSCIEPSVCTKCGLIFSKALGHDFNHESATCTEDKKCNRCGYIAQKALGHEYDTSTLYHNDDGHFNKCIRYDTCGAIGNFKEHIKEYGYIEGTEWKHNVRCTYTGCGWSKIEECTKSIKPKDIEYHTIYCEHCGRSEDIKHDDIRFRYIDKEKHMVYCYTCKSDLYLEEHIDIEEPFGICDRCEGVVNVNKAPTIEILTMENITRDIENKDYAKKGDTIKITVKASLLLAGAPTIKVQGQEISPGKILSEDNFTWYAEFKTSDYTFSEGKLTISVSNVKSLWGVYMQGEVTETTDNKYIIYDSIKPEYIYIK